MFDKVVMIGPALRKVTPLPLVGAGLAVVFMVAWLVWSQSAPAPESTTATVAIDPFEAYRQRMTQGISAHQRLNAISKLWAIAQSLPPGWEATRVEGEGKSVTLRFHRNPTGLIQTMNEWTSRYSKWAPYLTFDMQGGQIQLAMKPDLQHWAYQTVTVDQSQAWLSDVLNLAGIAPVSTQKNKESASITLDMNALSPSQWSVVADVSQQIPTLAERVNFQIGEAGTLSGPLTLTLYGESK
ncbi:hypothetical protein [Vibrio pectenicida]|uniref:Uncharacterized protein n=1 Tax=Vibrio pectenicida TaxID=62763 RepID=A0A427U536_9VIBR|nr:hypothetical protein [Vibrio pectenicida]RSD31740.1 hypothetical protein EJA03_07385 [Vibrio pectenicida]